MKYKSLLALMIAMGMSGLSACDNAGDSVQKLCTGDGCTCDDECEPGESKCRGTKVVSCIEDGNGCNVWGKARKCGNGLTCDESVGRCVEGCTNECTPDVIQCEGVQMRKCVVNEDDGCAYWSDLESCGENLHCDDATNSCVAGCVDECTVEGESFCLGENYRECGQFDEDECLEYSGVEACDSGEECDDATGKCRQVGCETGCNEGETSCDADGNVVQTCTRVGETDCFNWAQSEVCAAGRKCVMQLGNAVCVNDVEEICAIGSIKCSEDRHSMMSCEPNDSGNEWKSESCPTGTRCDAASKACIETCEVCDEDAVQCSADNKSVQVCVKDENGCTTWSDKETCGEAQSCKEGKCDYSCGDDCEPFSIVLIPDPQNYSKETGSNTSYHKEMRWIVENQNTEMIPNLKMVLHLGDITDHNYESEWNVAVGAHKILLDAGIQFSVTTGNHDYINGSSKGGRSNTKFRKKFPKEYLEKIPGYLDSYEDATNAFTFRAGNQDYLVIHLEFAPRQQAICWANKLIQKPENRNKKVILATHANISRGGVYGGMPNFQSVENGSGKDKLWWGITSRHSNIIMINNGHVGGSVHKTDEGKFGNKVQQILTDYQYEKPCNKTANTSCSANCVHTTGAGNGWVRIITFYPKENRVEVRTESAFSESASNFTKEKKPTFYCSSLFDESNKKSNGGSLCNDCGKWYSKSPTSTDHKFTLKYDFTTPSEDKFDEEYLAFIPRTINFTGSGDQSNPEVASNNSGRLAYVWEDDSSTADGNRYNSSSAAHDIFARVMTAESCEIEGIDEIKVNSNNAGHQSEPDVAMDDDGNFVVVWTDDSDNDGNTEIMMRGFNADGSERFADKIVNTETTRNQYQPHISMASDGHFVVAWTDKSSSDKTPQIKIRGFNADGSEAFAARDAADKVSGTRVKPDVFVFSDHKFVVAWEDDEDGNGGTQAWMRLYNADGTPRTDAKAANTNASGDQNAPSVSGKADGSKFIVAWQNSNNSKYAIMARTFDADGNQIDADFKFSSEGATKVADPQVCMNNEGNAMAAWYNPTTKNTVIHRFVDKAATGSTDIVNWPSNESKDKNKYGAPYAKAQQPGIACIPNGNHAAIVYADDNDGNEVFEIYAAGVKIK